MKKTVTIALSLILVLILLSLAGLGLGAAPLSLERALALSSSPDHYILFEMRLPRVISAILAGGILALSGLVFQSVFQNPMADSYLLGVSSGASLSVVLSALLFPSALLSLFLPYFAFIGALLAALLIFTVSKREPTSLILTGIAMNLLLSALTTLCIFISRRKTESVLFWSLGSFSSSNWMGVTYLFSALIILFTVTYLSATRLDILLLDSGTAASMGVDVGRTRIVMLVAASLATAVAVSLSGIIGFVGLISPHFIKLALGARHRRTIPLSMLLGGVIMLSADLVSRTLASPSELPVGIITSILGVPVFILLLRRRRYR